MDIEGKLGIDSLKDSVKSLTKAFISALIQKALITPLVDKFLPFFNPGSSTTPLPTPDPLAVASGAAFHNNRLTKFAGGGILNNPTLFGYNNNKLGLAGEAGSEAILPLQRDSRGRLGVSAMARSGAVQINVKQEINVEGNVDDGAANKISHQMLTGMREIVRSELVEQQRTGNLLSRNNRGY